MSQNSLRIEAIPLTWDSLSEFQRNAVEAVSKCLVDAIDAVPSKDRQDHSIPKLDRNRRSQLVFIDGDRGTGKSSVLLTLQDLKEMTKDSGTLPESVELLKDKLNRVVWLETLDMEPLSKGANLFAAILARIAKELDTNMSNLPPLAAAFGEQDSYADVQSQLQQLQNDAAIVWDRLDGNGHGVDPQTRALWVMQAEKAGLDLNHRIGKVLEGIAREFRTFKDKPPLFVLPVDDFDLAPAHCLELLRLIRMVTTPRLFFVVAGNTRIAETVLKLRCAGQLQSLSEGFSSSYTNEIKDCAAEIAINNMRKLIPPGQRVRLAELRLEEALDIGAITTENSAKDKTVKKSPHKEILEGSLREKLNALRFEVNQAPTNANTMSFLQFLLLDDFSVGSYATNAEWLAGTPRQVLDYVENFSHLVDLGARNGTYNGKNRHDGSLFNDRLLVALLEDIQRLINEEWRLTYIQREWLADMLDPSVSTSINLKANLIISQNFQEQRLREFEGGEIVNFNPTSTDVHINGKNQETPVLVSRRLGSGLLFVHDFAVSLWGGYFRHSPLTYETILGSRIFATWKIEAENFFQIRWCSPDWWTFRDFERFTVHWSLHSGQCDGQYGSAWLAATLEVVLNEKCQAGSSGLNPVRLGEFITTVVEEKPTRTARRLLRESCLVIVALLFAPESMSELNADYWSFLNKALNEAEIKGRIQKTRKQWLAEFLKLVGINISQNEELYAMLAPKLAWEYVINDIQKYLEGQDFILRKEVTKKVNKKASYSLDDLNLTSRLNYSDTPSSNFLTELQAKIENINPDELDTLKERIKYAEFVVSMHNHPINQLMENAPPRKKRK
ncbi:MAG: hypothetical protein EPN17_11390 [Methylobacter sp.]|nr:MAG: hypothetical protein EPN17_11390 [Methylobacter sp.]